MAAVLISRLPHLAVEGGRNLVSMRSSQGPLGCGGGQNGRDDQQRGHGQRPLILFTSFSHVARTKLTAADEAPAVASSASTARSRRSKRAFGSGRAAARMRVWPT